MIDHKRLTQAESRILRLMLSSVAALVGFVLVSGMIIGLASTLPITGTAVAATSAPDMIIPTPATISDDHPGWRCDTMGNRVCGVPNGNGQFVLVCHDVTGYPVRVVYDPFTCV